jgi:hypothetical protein
MAERQQLLMAKHVHVKTDKDQSQWWVTTSRRSNALGMVTDLLL